MRRRDKRKGDDWKGKDIKEEEKREMITKKERKIEREKER